MTSTQETTPVAIPQEEKNRQQVNTILARTDWGKYWSDVSVQVEQEVEAYDSARARSFAAASRRFLR